MYELITSGRSERFRVSWLFALSDELNVSVRSRTSFPIGMSACLTLASKCFVFVVWCWRRKLKEGVRGDECSQRLSTESLSSRKTSHSGSWWDSQQNLPDNAIPFGKKSHSAAYLILVLCLSAETFRLYSSSWWLKNKTCLRLAL